MLKKVCRLMSALLVAGTLLVTAAPVSGAQTPFVQAEFSGQFAGRTGATGSGTFDGDPADVAASFRTIVDSEGVPRTVIGRYDISNALGSVSVQFVSRLETFLSDTDLAFTETLTVVGGTGIYVDMGGRGHGTAFINLASGPPTIEIMMELRLHAEPLLCTYLPPAYW